MRGRDQLHVDLPVAHLAQAPEALLLEDLQQLRLDLRVEVADLVEEDDAAVRDLEQAGLARDRPGEGALLVAEQLGLEELARQARRSSCRRTARPRAGRCGAASGRGRPCRCPSRPRSGWGCSRPRSAAPARPGRGSPLRGPGEGVDGLARLAGAPGDLPALLALVLEQALQHHEQRRQLDGLGQELVGAFLHRAHGEVDARVAREDDDGQRRDRSPGCAGAGRAPCRPAACGRGRRRPAAPRARRAPRSPRSRPRRPAVPPPRGSHGRRIGSQARRRRSVSSARPRLPVGARLSHDRAASGTRRRGVPQAASASSGTRAGAGASRCAHAGRR